MVGDEKISSNEKNPPLVFRATEGVVDDSEAVGDEKNPPPARVSSDGGGGGTVAGSRD